MSSSQDNDALEPLLDTWRNFSGAATWMWTPRSRPSSREAHVLNVWGADQLSGLLEALRPFARVSMGLLKGPPGSSQLSNPEFTWDKRQTPHAGFERRLVEALRKASIPITSLELTLDLHVWVRTATSHKPTRGWVRGLADADFRFDVKSPYGALMMHHTLFRDGATHGDSNAELYRLNSPLLKQALAAIETRLGPIDHVEGLPGVTRTGFSPIG